MIHANYRPTLSLDHFSDGHVITRLSGKRIVTQEEGKVQRRESRSDILRDRGSCGGAAVSSVHATPYPVTARRRAVTVLVSPLHIEEPAPAALVGVEFFFFFLCGRTFVRPAALARRRVFFSFGHVVPAAAQRGSWSSDGA